MIGRKAEMRELARVAGLRADANDSASDSVGRDQSAELHSQEAPAPLVIVYGAASTGKSMGVAHALRQHASAHAVVDCTAIYSPKEFYREVMAQLQDNSAFSSSQYVQPAAKQPGDGISISMDSHEQLNINGNGQVEGKAGASEPNSEAIAVQSKHSRQSQTDTYGDSERFSSLNFLSFFKALDTFMTATNSIPDATASKKHTDRRRVLYLALDHADNLLDRGMSALLTCVFTIKEQLAYLNMFADAPPWEICVLLVTRGLSMAFDKLVAPFFPVYVAFPPYTREQIADILIHQLDMQSAGERFRSWLVHLYGLLPSAADSDWLDFRAAVVHLLPQFQAEFFSQRSTPHATKKRLELATNAGAQSFLKTRRKHLFGYHKLGHRVGDPSELISCANLSRSCLLLVLAGYLASFNPQDADTHFLSSSGGMRRKKRAKKSKAGEANSVGPVVTAKGKKQQVNQLLIGPRIFALQRLLAIYLNLRAEAEADRNANAQETSTAETREEIFVHLATLVRMQLFQRTSPPNVLDDVKFRCLADARFVHETARYLKFPLNDYLNRAD